jgi:hypothetical protein
VFVDAVPLKSLTKVDYVKGRIPNAARQTQGMQQNRERMDRSRSDTLPFKVWITGSQPLSFPCDSYLLARNLAAKSPWSAASMHQPERAHEDGPTRLHNVILEESAGKPAPPKIFAWQSRAHLVPL